MNEQIIQDWLSECAALSSVEVNSFASSLKHNNDLITALYRIFNDYKNFSSLIEAVSKQLFNFYRSRESELKLFTLQFVPNFIYIYLNSVAQGNKKCYRCVETLLIGIYNLEVVDDSGQPVVISFRLPSLAQASTYHEPMSLAHASLTETALRRLEECNTKLISWGPNPQVETLNAQNRLRTLTGILFIYNRHIGSLNKMSLKYLCKVSSSLASQGFDNSLPTLQSDSTNSEGSTFERLARIPVSSQFFLELLCGLYYAMYNDFGYLAMQAVVDIYNRSCYECYANVIVVANAIKNSSNVCSTGETSEGRPMGISVALSPATNTVTTVNKFMITNASFRTKKLPDDLELEIQSNGSPPISSDNDLSAGEPQSHKSIRKGKWKGWNWLHNASSRSVAEECPEEVAPARRNQSLGGGGGQSSPVEVKRGNSRRFSADVQTRLKEDEFTTNVPPFGSGSPKRRVLRFVESSPNRVSAGARLCKVFEEDNVSLAEGDGLDEEDKGKWFVSGRPSSLNLAGNDIPIIPKDESNAGESKPLTSITEEKEEPGFSARGSSLRSKDAVTKNLQKLGLGKKFKEKEGKSSSKTNLAGNQGAEKKQTTSFQMSNLMEKMSLKSAVVQNGEFGQADVDGHSPLTVTRKKTTENGPVSEVSNGGIAEGMTTAKGSSGFVHESSSAVTSEGLESSAPGDDILGLHNSTKNPEEKPFMQVSSV